MTMRLDPVAMVAGPLPTARHKKTSGRPNGNITSDKLSLLLYR